MSTQDLGDYEMLWDCPYCGQKKLLAKTHRHCPSCGAVQADTALRYFPPDGEAVAVQDHQFVGADLICPGCMAPCAASANNCGNCGSSLAGVKQASVRGEQAVAEGQAFADETVADAKREKRAAADAQRQPAAASSSSRRGRGIWIALAAAAVIAVALYFVFRNHEAGVVITGHSWERVVNVEAMRPTPQSAWCDQLPARAYGVSRTREQRSSKSVPDGEECQIKRVDKGDGTFKKQRECKPKFREEPVYDEKCHFTIDAWTHARAERAAGASLAETPRWPEVKLREGPSAGSGCLGCEREAGRTETYKLLFRDAKSGDAGDCEVPQPKWQGAPDGSKWIIRVGLSGADCATMTAAP